VQKNTILDILSGFPFCALHHNIDRTILNLSIMSFALLNNFDFLQQYPKNTPKLNFTLHLFFAILNVSINRLLTATAYFQQNLTRFFLI